MCGYSVNQNLVKLNLCSVSINKTLVKESIIAKVLQNLNMM